MTRQPKAIKTVQRMNVSRYIGHAAIFCSMYTIACCYNAVCSVMVRNVFVFGCLMVLRKQLC